MVIRSPTHAGSWYDSNHTRLSRQLDEDLAKVGKVEGHPEITFPTIGCKAIIAPHAGYSYSGPTAAWAYKAIDVLPIKRVFLLGPSHHVHLSGCALSKCTAYGTPLGDIALDQKVIQELKATKNFTDMSIDTDEDEHSLEMHLPYIRRVFQDRDITLVPILVGAIDNPTEKKYGKILSKYYEDQENLFIISSDFAHWGTRFRYTYYASPSKAPISLKSGNVDVHSLKEYPIYKSISQIDHEGMAIIESQPFSEAHDQFSAYLKRTNNTICGRHPIGVLLALIADYESARSDPQASTLTFIKYDQSSECKSLADSSVSYASAIVTLAK